MPATGLKQSRRGLLTAMAAAPLIGVTAFPAMADGDDSELFALEAQIMQLHERAASIRKTRINPYEEKFYYLLREPHTENDRWIARVLGPQATKEGYKAACAFSEAIGRDAAMEETEALFIEADPLIATLIGTPARTAPGRVAKVRVLLTCVHGERWSGPADELDWQTELTRQLLGEFAGLSESDLAAI